ncbi:outer membrane protein transport protein [Ciceribacter sp. L1K22]|uniref:OmpP1/FadL family transporter n=1 Tax=Ciceribacter sp. L1K22 TaxID=2820275 RepID=UPI001FEED874|nr:outer membrane protein transport protein [Ciceribacter sp. L1K22]
MNIIKKTAVCLLGTCALVSAANAGGFTRGEADTDLLYEDGTFVVRGGATYVSPHRDYDTIGGVSATDDRYTEDYVIPSFAAKWRMSDNFSCVVSYTQPFGAKSEYGDEAQAADRNADIAAFAAADPADPGYAGLQLTAALGGNAVITSEFKTNEFGGTCAANFAAGPGDFYAMGGVFLQSFDYTESKDFGTLNLKDDSAFGYRIGAAYEIKEYAFRAELMYRSEVEHKASGKFTVENAGLAGYFGVPVGTQFDSTGGGSLPQSLELNLQSGIAPGWLAYGSVKWTDWSVLQTLNYDIDNIGPQEKNFFWKDGWTITAGVGHSFTENVSGALQLTWDQGVGTGADIMSDTWTLGAGTQIKAGPGVLRLGAAVTYLTSGSQSTADGADFDATANGDWAYAINGSYKIAF